MSAGKLWQTVKRLSDLAILITVVKNQGILGGEGRGGRRKGKEEGGRRETGTTAGKKG